MFQRRERPFADHRCLSPGFKVSKQKKVEEKLEDPPPTNPAEPFSAQNRSNSHLIVLAETLNMLRKKGSLCDVTIETKGKVKCLF